MAKLTLTDLTDLQNESSAVTDINNNNADIETAVENTVSRDGTTPNMMEAELDMNSNLITNLPTPVSGGDAVNKDYVDDRSSSIGKTGTPADSQVAVWTSSTILEGDTNLTFDTSTDTLVTVNATIDRGNVDEAGVAYDLASNVLGVGWYYGTQTDGKFTLNVPTGKKFSAFYVSGTHNDAGEFRAFNFDITAGSSATGDAVRGVVGQVIGDNNAGAIKAIHGTAAGTNGHTGDLIGVVGQTDPDPASGESYAFQATVGDDPTGRGGAMIINPMTGGDQMSYGIRFRNSVDITRQAILLDHQGVGDFLLLRDSAGVVERFKVDASGNIETAGTVDGRDIDADGTALDTVVASEANAIHNNIAAEINELAGKTTPVDADITLVEDSAASWGKKKLTWANIKATLKTYFDTLYSAVSHSHATTDITSGTMADARIAESNVTQHEAAIDHDALTNFNANEHINWTNTGQNLVTSGSVRIGSATGGAQSAIIAGSTDRFYIAPTDQAGSFQWAKEFTFDAAGDAVWKAEGGFKTTGDLTCEGFTSTGINDDATTEVMKLTSDDNYAQFGDADKNFYLVKQDNLKSIGIGGGATIAEGINMHCYAGSHPTLPDVWRVRRDTTQIFNYDGSNLFEFFATDLELDGGGANTTLTINSNADVTNARLDIREGSTSGGYIQFNGTGNDLEFGTHLSSSDTRAFWLDRGSANLNLDGLLVAKSYTVAGLPTGANGAIAYASDLRVFDGAGTQETGGNGTGGHVTYNGTNWVIMGTNVTAVA